MRESYYFGVYFRGPDFDSTALLAPKCLLRSSPGSPGLLPPHISMESRRRPIREPCWAYLEILECPRSEHPVKYPCGVYSRGSTYFHFRELARQFVFESCVLGQCVNRVVRESVASAHESSLRESSGRESRLASARIGWCRNPPRQGANPL